MKTARLLLVPSSILGATATLYGIALAILWFSTHRLTPSFVPEETLNAYWFLVILCAGMFVAGVAREKRYDPALNIRYARWLAATPWHAPKPLPLGPLHLVWQDLALLAIPFLLARFHLHVAGPAPASAFLAGYLLMAFATLSTINAGKTVTLLLIVLPAALLDLQSEWWIFSVLLATYILTALGIDRALHHFPWKLLDLPADKTPGWPFIALGQLDPNPKIPAPHAFLVSALFGWWTFCLTFNADFPPPEDTSSLLPLLALLAGIIVALLRWLAYVLETRAPISLLGRFFSGHWIIPGYDRVLLAPLCVLVAGAVAASVVAIIPFPPLACGVGIAIILLPALLVGPSLGAWRLTGTYSMIVRRPMAQNTQRSTRTSAASH